ncbi:MAG: dihydrodipicolinate synthase family protein [Burkholderiales bacterium]|nr:dihydrodipicolinate synthase family protein [Burkholderiales bacterium]
MDIHGLIPATVTPFRADGSVNYEELAAHAGRVSTASGLYGVCVNGHAGEILALTCAERARIVSTARKAIAGELKLIAGIASHSLADLVQQGLDAKRAGADMLLVFPLFDVRPYRHLARNAEVVFSVFERLDREVNLPMSVFQYPDTTGSAYSLEALCRIAELPNVVAMKAATGSPTKYAEIHDALHDKISVLVACDAPSLLGMLLHDAPGALVGISAIATQRWSDLVREATSGSAQKAKEIHNSFALPLMDALYEYQLHRTPIATPASNKEALVQLGELTSSWVRPPAVNVDAAKREAIRAALVKTGLLQSAPAALKKTA